MNATIIKFRPKPKPLEAPPIAELTPCHLATLLETLPPGMTSRQFDKVLWHCVRFDREAGSAYCKAWDRAIDAQRELIAALNDARRLAWEATWRHYPQMARRIAKKRRDRP
jgi:hypothetical protein